MTWPPFQNCENLYKKLLQHSMFHFWETSKWMKFSPGRNSLRVLNWRMSLTWDNILMSQEESVVLFSAWRAKILKCYGTKMRKMRFSRQISIFYVLSRQSCCVLDPVSETNASQEHFTYAIRSPLSFEGKINSAVRKRIHVWRPEALTGEIVLKVDRASVSSVAL